MGQRTSSLEEYYVFCTLQSLSHLLLWQWETHSTHDRPDYEPNKSRYRQYQTEQCPPRRLLKEPGSGPSMPAGFENVHLTQVGSMTRQSLYLSTTGAPMSYPLSLPPPRTRLWAFYPISQHWTIERFILAIATIYLPESEIRRSPSVSLTEDTRVQRRPQGHGTTRPQDPWAKPELVQKFCLWHGVWSSSRVHSYAIHVYMRPWFINSWLED